MTEYKKGKLAGRQDHDYIYRQVQCDGYMSNILGLTHLSNSIFIELFELRLIKLFYDALVLSDLDLLQVFSLRGYLI